MAKPRHFITKTSVYEVEQVLDNEIEAIECSTRDFCSLPLGEKGRLVSYFDEEPEQELVTTRTAIIQMLSEMNDKVFKVGFRKKLDPVKTASLLENEDYDSKDIANILKGEFREAVVVMSDFDHLMGRSLVLELTDEGVDYIQIDHRTIEYFVTANTKFRAK